MMKNGIVYMVLLLLVTSCNDFLTSKEEDKVIPTKAQHFKELIYGELVNVNTDFLSFTDVMGDNIGMEKVIGGSAAEQKKLYSYYTWQSEPEYDLESEIAYDPRYYQLYRMILLCNSIEELLKDVNDDPEQVVNLYGEVYFVRAWCYWALAGLYGVPYVDEAASQTTPCVPLNEAKGIDQIQYPRATQRQIFDKIENDLKLSADYFERSVIPATLYRPNLKAVYILATRVYLTEKKYDRVVEFANKLESDYRQLYRLSDLHAQNGGNQINDVSIERNLTAFLNKKNNEIAYSFSNYSIMPFQASFSYTPLRRLTATSFIKMYENDDLRKTIYFDNWGQPAKCRSLDQSIFGLNFRVGEALLNRAEAYLMTDERTKAMDDLDVLRQARFKEGADYQVDRGGDLLKTLQKERALELCFEGLRWFDLRRWGCPEIVHRYVGVDGLKTEYTLKAGDIAYTLPIPLQERERNMVIENINRPVRSGVIVQE